MADPREQTILQNIYRGKSGGRAELPLLNQLKVLNLLAPDDAPQHAPPFGQLPWQADAANGMSSAHPPRQSIGPTYLPPLHQMMLQAPTERSAPHGMDDPQAAAAEFLRGKQQTYNDELRKIGANAESSVQRSVAESAANLQRTKQRIAAANTDPGVQRLNAKLAEFQALNAAARSPGVSGMSPDSGQSSLVSFMQGGGQQSTQPDETPWQPRPLQNMTRQGVYTPSLGSLPRQPASEPQLDRGVDPERLAQAQANLEARRQARADGTYQAPPVSTTARAVVSPERQAELERRSALSRDLRMQRAGERRGIVSLPSPLLAGMWGGKAGMEAELERIKLLSQSNLERDLGQQKIDAAYGLADRNAILDREKIAAEQGMAANRLASAERIAQTQYGGQNGQDQLERDRLSMESIAAELQALYPDGNIPADDSRLEELRRLRQGKGGSQPVSSPLLESGSQMAASAPPLSLGRSQGILDRTIGPEASAQIDERIGDAMSTGIPFVNMPSNTPSDRVHRVAKEVQLMEQQGLLTDASRPAIIAKIRSQLGEREFDALKTANWAGSASEETKQLQQLLGFDSAEMPVSERGQVGPWGARMIRKMFGYQ